MAKTSWKKLGDPRFLGEYHFDDNKDKILSLKEVRNEETFEVNSKKKQLKRTGIFNETKLMMVLNSTNCQKLEKLFSSDKIEDWYGKPFAIYFDPTVKLGKKQIGGLRIRTFLPKDKATFICENCGITIENTEQYTAEQISRSTTQTFGKSLCMGCGAKAKEKAEKPTVENMLENMEESEDANQ